MKPQIGIRYLTLILKVISHLRGITLATRKNDIVIVGKIKLKKKKKKKKKKKEDQELKCREMRMSIVVDVVDFKSLFF
jgi:hypothetical protein